MKKQQKLEVLLDSEYMEHLSAEDSLKLYDEFERSFDETYIPLLRELLQSQDIYAIGRGLYFFGSLGSKVFELLDEALNVALYIDNIYAQSNLLDGILCYPQKLNANQVAQTLPLVEHEDALIRSKMVSTIRAYKLKAVEDAIGLLTPEEKRCAHKAALKEAMKRTSNPQLKFDWALQSDTIQQVYLLSFLERQSAIDLDFSIPTYAGASYLGDGAIRQMRRLSGILKRKHDKASKSDTSLSEEDG